MKFDRLHSWARRSGMLMVFLACGSMVIGGCPPDDDLVIDLGDSSSRIEVTDELRTVCGGASDLELEVVLREMDVLRDNGMTYDEVRLLLLARCAQYSDENQETECADCYLTIIDQVFGR